MRRNSYDLNQSGIYERDNRTNFELFIRNSVLVKPRGRYMRRRWEACICAIALLAPSAVAQPTGRETDGDALRSPDPDARVVLRDGKFMQGRFVAWSPEAIEVASNPGVRTLRAQEVRRVAVQQKNSQWKGAMVGALIGFGVGFPIGAASAGHLTDRNNPGFATRAGMRAGLGILGAGIAAAMNALADGTKDVTVYRLKERL